MKRVLEFIFGGVVLLLFLTAVHNALAADFTLTGGGASIAYPQKRWLRDSVTVINTSNSYQEFAYYIILF